MDQLRVVTPTEPTEKMMLDILDIKVGKNVELVGWYVEKVYHHARASMKIRPPIFSPFGPRGGVTLPDAREAFLADHHVVIEYKARKKPRVKK